MIYSLGELGMEIDFGLNTPGAILQRKEKGHWHDYLVDGKPVTKPFDVKLLDACELICFERNESPTLTVIRRKTG
jgi:hypothetical protein